FVTDCRHLDLLVSHAELRVLVENALATREPTPLVRSSTISSLVEIARPSQPAQRSDILRAVTLQSSGASSLGPDSLSSPQPCHHHGQAAQRSTGAPLPPRQFSTWLNIRH